MRIKRDDNGDWEVDYLEKRLNPNYVSSLRKYLPIIDQIFIKAKQKDEFEFIMTLLRVKGMQSPGWDPFETINEMFETLKTLINKGDNTTSTHLSLFLYGQILEASDPYQILANLLNISLSKRYTVENFPDHVDPLTGRKQSQSIIDKINQLKSNAKKNKLSVDFFDEFVDLKLRNSIYHSNYAVFFPEIRIQIPAIYSYTLEEWQSKVQNSIAYFDAFRTILKFHISLYNKPKIVKVPQTFSPVCEDGLIIVRKNYGIVGIKDAWSEKEIKEGKIPFLMARLLDYENALVLSGQIFLPSNKIERINTLLKRFPMFIRMLLVKLFSKYKHIITRI